MALAISPASKPPAVQEPPAQSVCIPLHTTGPHLLKWPLTIASNQIVGLAELSPPESNLRFLPEIAQRGTPTARAHSADTDSRSAEPTQTGSGPSSRLRTVPEQSQGQAAAPETATVDLTAGDKSPDGTEHRKWLGQASVGQSQPESGLANSSVHQKAGQQASPKSAAKQGSQENSDRLVMSCKGTELNPDQALQPSTIQHETPQQSSPDSMQHTAAAASGGTEHSDVAARSTSIAPDSFATVGSFTHWARGATPNSAQAADQVKPAALDNSLATDPLSAAEHAVPSRPTSDSPPEAANTNTQDHTVSVHKEKQQ